MISILTKHICIFCGVSLLISCGLGHQDKRAETETITPCLDPKAYAAPVNIPGGDFILGGQQYYPEERPAHIISIKAFNIDATEVTNRQFSEFVAATAYVTRAEKGLPEAKYQALPNNLRRPGSVVFIPPNSAQAAYDASWWVFVEGANWRAPTGPESSIIGLDDHPVVHIAFEDALAYARWRGRRLPTENEWEAALSPKNSDDNPEGGSLINTPAVKAPLPAQANIWQGIFPYINEAEDKYIGTAPVGCFKPNQHGLYDMIGNVWELTSSEFSSHSSEQDSALKDLNHDNEFGYGVIKGGSYLCAQNYCARYRSTARQAQEWALGASHIGFRTVADRP